MKYRIYLLVLLILVSSASVYAAGEKRDSVTLKNGKSLSVVRESPFRVGMLSVPGLVTGFSLIGNEKHVMNSRTTPAPEYDANFDDYMRCSPAALLLGLKLGGVKSRSSWGRMLVSDAFSGVLMYGISEGLKRTVGVPRPNGVNDKSFPSGHTAMAFMFAAMVDKEYGATHPYISLIGYSLATYTAVSRIINFKHQTGDVLAGAGIGIMSTELGYLLADLIFKDRGLSYISDKTFVYNSPNWIGLDFGVGFGLTDYKSGGNVISVGNGSASKISGGYFFNNYFGLGGNVGYSNYTISQNGEFANKYLDCISVSAGPQFTYNTDVNIRLGARMGVGYVRYLKSALSDNMTVGNRNGFVFETGVSASVPLAEKYSMKVFCDYNLCGSCLSGSSKPLNSLSVGTSVQMNF